MSFAEDLRKIQDKEKINRRDKAKAKRLAKEKAAKDRIALAKSSAKRDLQKHLDKIKKAAKSSPNSLTLKIRPSHYEWQDYVKNLANLIRKEGLSVKIKNEWYKGFHDIDYGHEEPCWHYLIEISL